MASNAFSGIGTTFSRSNGASTPSYTAIAEINSIDGPKRSRGLIDVTSLDSTGGYREKIPGFRDGGQVSLAMNFTQAGFLAINDDFESEDLVGYKIALPDGTDITFNGFVTDLGLSVPTDDKVTMPVTITISGAPDISS